MPVVLWRRKTVSSAISTRRPARLRFGVAAAGAAAAPESKMEDAMGQQQQEQHRQFWLLKTEPDVWSWQNQEENSGLSVWDGVRNAQAQKHMKSMSVDDLCLFYHTGKSKEVVGIVQVVKTFYPDPTDATEKWGAVDVREVEALKQAVTLAQMKNDDHFTGFFMLRQPRLSVVPVDETIWERVCELGGVESAKFLGVKENGKTGGGSVKKEKRKAEVEGGTGTDEKGFPANGVKAPNRKRRELTIETTDEGSAKNEQAKEVMQRPRETGRSHNKSSETEEAATGSRTPKTRKKKPQ